MAWTSAFDGSAYVPEAILGTGAMGQVWRVRHSELGTTFAAKVLKPGLGEKEAVVERIRAEARALSKLDHRNLVRVFDLNRTPDGLHYFVMELLVGRDLGRILRTRGVLPIGESVEIALQALNGLGAAHDVGLVHRDLKPANVFVCDEGGVVKVVDFGVAKHDPKSVDAPPTPTRHGVVMGTPRYFSPEMCRGKGVDRRSDIYAMGLILYRMVTGRGPFDDVRGLAEIMRAHVARRPKPPSAYAPDIPKQLDTIILRALEKQPENRYPSVQALASALRPLRHFGGSERAPLATAPTRLAPFGDEPTAATRLPGVEARNARVAVTEVITEPLSEPETITEPLFDPPKAQPLRGATQPIATEPWSLLADAQYSPHSPQPSAKKQRAQGNDRLLRILVVVLAVAVVAWVVAVVWAL